MAGTTKRATKVRAAQDFTRAAARLAREPRGVVSQMTARPAKASSGGPMPFTVPAADARILESWIRGRTTPQRVAMRSRVVLLAARGFSNRQIGRSLEISASTAALWRRRYEQHGPQALLRDASGRGAKATIPDDARARLRELHAREAPDGRRWTIRGLAAATGISRASVHRLLQACEPESRA